MMEKLFIRKRSWWLSNRIQLGWGLFICCLFTIHCTNNDTIAVPNIVLIMADDMGIETLNCYGGSSYQTPNLDSLASQGIVFDQCYSTPLCTPSRVQIMTGKYNFRNYVGFGILDSNEHTFGHLFQEMGYRTLVAGKWQLYGNEQQFKLAGQHGSLPRQAGFDEYCLWQVLDRGPRYKNPVIDVNGQLQTFTGNFGPDVFTHYISDFITRHKKDPFFVYYPMCLVHDPFVPTPWSDNYDQTEKPKSDTANFGSMMTYMDHQVGKILEVLKNEDLLDNTLVLFIGDNGTGRKVHSTWNNQDVRGRKGFPVKWGTHIPMIASWGNHIRSGTRSNQLVDFTDFYASFKELTKYSSEALIDGRSFLSALQGEPVATREYVFNHYDPNWGNFEKSRHVHNGVWKLYEDGRFYYVKKDFDEIQNLADSTLSDEVLELKTKFSEILQQLQ